MINWGIVLKSLQVDARNHTKEWNLWGYKEEEEKKKNLDFPLPCVSGTPQYSSVHYIHRQKFSVNLFISSRRVQLQEIKVHIKIQTHTLRAVQGQ